MTNLVAVPARLSANGKKLYLSLLNDPWFTIYDENRCLRAGGWLRKAPVAVPSTLEMIAGCCCSLATLLTVMR